MKFKKKRSTKICFISLYGYQLYNRMCKVPYGGAEVQIYLLSKELAKNKNLSINVLTGDFHFKKNRIERLYNLNIHFAIPIKKTFINKIRRPLNLFISLIQLNPDVIIQRGGTTITGLCAFYCKLFRKKFIFSIAHRNDVIKHGKKGLIGILYRFGLINATFIVAQNNDQILNLKNWRKKRILNIKTIKSGYEIPNVKVKKKNILWVGRAYDWKRPECFLKIAEKFSNNKFIMICNKGRNQELWKIIKEKSKKITNLEFHDFIPFNKIDKYFREAKVFINTSTSEGFPNSFIQAFKNYTPVISLNVDPDKILTKNKIGFFCNDDFNKIVKYLKLLISNYELYESYSKNAFLYVKNNHDINKICKEWIQLIELLL